MLPAARRSSGSGVLPIRSRSRATSSPNASSSASSPSTSAASAANLGSLTQELAMLEDPPTQGRRCRLDWYQIELHGVAGDRRQRPDRLEIACVGKSFDGEVEVGPATERPRRAVRERAEQVHARRAEAL